MAPDGFSEVQEQFTTEQRLKLDQVLQRTGLNTERERLRYLRISGWDVDRACSLIAQESRRRESW